MKLREVLEFEFNWWENVNPQAKNQIQLGQYRKEIFSDASTSGWGAYCEGETTFGFWTDYEKKNHINYLELMAAFFGLKCFTKNLSNCEVLLRVDNTTAIAYINRMGGVQFPNLNEVTHMIWDY